MGNLPKIQGYKIEKLLGEGGMASVYKGIEESLGRKVAIKILDKKLLRDPKILERFNQESRTAANLYHSNIISVYKIGTLPDGDHPYIVMEFLEETLKDHMLGFPGFYVPAQKALDIILPIMGALEYAHKQGVIHRDIKTDNIMFRQDQTPVLVDFGIARVQDSNALTRDGTSLGTPYYMSPEQCQAQPLDGRSDVYSLGVVLFEIITGSKPFEGDTPVAVAIKHIQEPVPQLPEELRRYQLLIDKMMAKKKEDRISTEMELILLVDSLSTPGKVPPAPVPQEPAQTVAEKPAGPPPKRKMPQPPPPRSLPPQPTPVPTAASVKTSVVDAEKVNAATATTRKPYADHTRVMESTGSIETPPPAAGGYLDKTLYPTGITLEQNKVPGKSMKIPGFSILLDKLARHPHRKKIEFGALGAAVIIIFLIFYNLGSGGGNRKADSGPVIQPAAQTKPVIETVTPPKVDVKNAPLTRENLAAKVNLLISSGALPDLEAAKQVLAQAKEKNWQDVEGFDQLMQRVDTKIGEHNDEAFLAYFDKAHDYFKKGQYREAFGNLKRAEEIKQTPELKAFKQQVSQKLRRSGVRPETVEIARTHSQARDDSDYREALAANTPEAFQGYVDKYPSGRHVDEAVEKVAELREMARIKQQEALAGNKKPFHLRSRYKTLSYTEIEAMIKQRSFFDDSFNQGGNFKNDFEARRLEGKPVVIDNAIGLMWYNGRDTRETTYEKALKWIKDLNRSRYGGFDDWRLPTVEEAASLLEKKKNASDLHISGFFSTTIKRIWTGDMQRAQTYWVVRFQKGIVYGASDRSNHHIRPVRSMQ